jgi:putative flippase GtrA
MATTSQPNYWQRSLPVIRYLLSGGAAVTVEYTSFLLLFYVLSAPLIIGNSLSFLLGMLTSFLMNRQWTFKGSKGRIHYQLVLYALLALINMSLTNVLMWQFTTWGMLPFVAKLFIIALCATWNFFIFKKVIFKKKVLDT